MKHSVLKRALLPALLAIGMSAPSAAFAGAGDIALGVKGGTTGIGGEVTVGVIDKLNFRTGYNFFNYDGNATESGIDYDYKLKLRTLPLLLDLHPFSSGFRVTSGIFINNNEVTGTATAQGSYDIGGTTYNAADIGSLDAKIDFRKTAPYLGIGWGNAVGKNSRLTIAFDAGVMFQGTPKVSLTPRDVQAGVDTALLQKNIDKEIADVKDDIDNLKYYPIISLGLAYKF
ncbi:hypothetical protein EST62_05540 [Chlorobaculum sp. 24CR]|uniref:hypothetical protein n=1 Tax=Chlorobaculum sp. 24CR TaxID=2508878 RepID=UPI00100B1E84|nr:hypothetical protein [Chlorobaculum sp. 24CR]RXK87974.1 hypothetical protein EST62_05540 [Chlorobaculum sp. 24CR]